MIKLVKCVFLCFILTVFVWCGALLRDRQKLSKELIRLHVVANSDSLEDQTVKLRIRDAISQSLEKDMAAVADTEQALGYLQQQLPKLQEIANSVLKQAGMEPDAVISLCRERFDTRFYDTFSLPAGVYNALRITIGDGQGKNWWCVVYPTLCQPSTVSGFDEAALEAGFTEELSNTLTSANGYRIRFYLLDKLGELENILFEG